MSKSEAILFLLLVVVLAFAVAGFARISQCYEMLAGDGEVALAAATPTNALSSYVYGRAVDAGGKLMAGVRVEIGSRASETNDSGSWGQDWGLASKAGQEVNLYAFPEVQSVEAPAGVVVRRFTPGNVVTFVVPNPVPAQIGPFVLHMAATMTPLPTFTNTPTRTPTPTEWVVTQTPTPLATATPLPTPTFGPATLDIPAAARHMIAYAVYESYWQQERVIAYDDFLYTPFWTWTQERGQWGLPMTKVIYVTVNDKTYLCLGFVCEIAVMVEGDDSKFAVLDYAGNQLNRSGTP